jgi:hypothetical protein
MSAQVQSLSESVGGLGGLDELGQNVPLTNLAPTGPGGLNFANALVQSLKDQLTGQALSSLTELQAYLNDPARDGDFAGVHVDVGAPTLGQTGGNVYYVCPSTYGDYISTRAIAPGLITFLQNLSQGDTGSLHLRAVAARARRPHRLERRFVGRPTFD